MVSGFINAPLKSAVDLRVSAARWVQEDESYSPVANTSSRGRLPPPMSFNPKPTVGAAAGTVNGALE